MIDNPKISIIIGLFFAFAWLGALLYVTVLQTFEVATRPKDGLTALRNMIYVMLWIAVLGRIPSITYQLCALFDLKAPFLQNVARITGNIAGLASGILLVMIFRYRVKK